LTYINPNDKINIPRFAGLHVSFSSRDEILGVKNDILKMLNALQSHLKGEQQMHKHLSACIIGCGGISELHAKGWKSDKSINLYTFDTDEKRAKALAEKYQAEAWLGTYEDVLSNDEIDIVDICVPHHLHVEVTVAAAEAGKHILLEKPIARTLEEADRIIKATEENDVRFMVAECWWFYPPVLKARELLDKGEIGDVFLITINDQAFYSPSGWRTKKRETGGGTLLDRGIHFVNIMRHLGGEVESVYAQVSDKSIVAMEGEDTGGLNVRFQNGNIGQFICSWGTHTPFQLPRFAVYGTKGTLYDLNGLYVYTPNLVREPKKVADSLLEPYMIPKEIEHFVRNLRGGREFAVTGEEARNDLEIVIAAYQSAQTGQVVTLPVSSKT